MKIIIFFLFVCIASTGELFAQIDIKNNSSNKIDITSNTLRLFPKKRQAIFKENVIATQDDAVLNSDIMTVFYHDDEGKKRTGNTISIIDAEGDVILTMPDKKAQAEYGKFDVDRGIIIMTKNVKILQGEGELSGEKLVYDTVVKRSYIYGKGNGLPEESDEERIKQALAIRKNLLHPPKDNLKNIE